MPDATMTELESKRNEILLAMQNLAESQPEPGEVRVGDIVHKGDEDLDTPMIISGVREAGIVYIYDTRTGERSRTNRNMLPSQLMKKRPDGSQVFSVEKPAIEPVRGQLKCLLHPDLRKEYPEFDVWGLPHCMKSNLPSPFAVKSHMIHRHKRQWDAIEENRTQKEKDEERRMMREGAAATAAALRAATEKPEKVTQKAG